MARWIVALLALSSLAAAQDADREAPLSEGELALIAANNRLAWKLVADWPEDGNRIVVPLPLLVQLRALSVGMQEEVVPELSAIAAVEGDVRDEDYAALIRRLTSTMPDAEAEADGALGETEASWRRNRTCTLRLPSLLMYDGRIPLPQADATRLEVILGEPPLRVDLRDAPATRSVAGGWLERTTDGLLADIDLPTLDPALPGLLSLSALQLRAGWHVKFHEPFTEDARFHLDEENTRAVAMMSYRGMQQWAGDERAQVVRRSASGGIIVDFALSARGRSVRDLELQLASDGGLAPYLDALDHEVGRLRVPRFDIEADWDVADMMRASGVESLFEPGRAALAGVPMPLLDARQRSTLAIDELGICATSLSRTLRAAGGTDRPPFDFHADRPFLVVVRHAPTGVILLIARIADPGSGD